MQKGCLKILGLGALVLVVPFLVFAKDGDGGEKMKLKDATVQKVVSDQGLLVVKKNGNFYNLAMGLVDPDKGELLSKYGIMVDPMELQEGDKITCRGRRFTDYFVPSKCRVEKGSQKKLYKAKEGVMIADVYEAYDISPDEISGASKIIYAAHSLNKFDLTAIEGKKITDDGDKVSINELMPYWRLKIKGTWKDDKKMMQDIKYIKVISKHVNEPKYGY